MSAVIDESQRQRALDAYHIVDTLPETAYEDIVRLASEVCGTPMALVTLIDRDRQWVKARNGVELTATPRNVAFCDHAIREPDQVMVVADAEADPRFTANPLVTGHPDIRFYAGAPLVNAEGAAIGTVCVLDREPRDLSPAQRAGLASLARLTMSLLDSHRRDRELERDAALASAVAAETGQAGAADLPPPRRTVVLFELQDFAGAVKRMGERAVERELTALAAALEARLRPAAGDSLNRVTGSHELIAVVHGDDVFSALQALQDEATAFERDTSLQVLSAFAEAGDAGEGIHTIFLRAADALSSLKDARAAL